MATTFNEYLSLPASKKITMVEIDSPLDEAFQNYQPGIWFAWLTPGAATELDDDGNLIHWGTDNAEYYNIGSVNVAGELYAEATTLNNCIATEKSWFYDTATTYLYVHFEDWNPPGSFTTVAPGAVIGFTNNFDNTVDNYFEDVYYKALLKSIPNMTKKKDPLFFGILQFQGGTILFNNEDGEFDDFAKRDLYGQPIRIRLSFEGLPYADSLLVYTGKVEDFTHDYLTFKLKVADIRKLLSRKLPVNVFDSGTYPTMDSKLIGLPIPLIFWSVIGVPAYRTSAGNWKFADTTFNAIDSGISVYDKDGGAFGHGGVETDGTFTGADTTDKLYVDCEQSSVSNGLDVISDILENYENVTFNSTNYDTVEWNKEKNNVMDAGIWLGRGNLKTSVDIIEQICNDNNGIFDILADGKFTFKTLDEDGVPVTEIYEDELISDPQIIYNADKYLSSALIEYSKDWLNKESEIYTNTDFEAEVFGRYRQYKERTFKTALTSEADSITLSNSIMELSKFIFPGLKLKTKTQHIKLRVLDNALYTYSRIDGSEIIARSRYQVLGVSLNLSAYELNIEIQQIKEDDSTLNQMILGETETDMILGETETDMILGIPYWTQGE